MKITKLQCFLLLQFFPIVIWAQNKFTETQRTYKSLPNITIELEVSEELREYWQKENVTNEDSLTFRFISVQRVGSTEESQTVSLNTGNKVIKMEFLAHTPLFIRTRLFAIPILSPGDSIRIRYQEGTFVYSGKGAEKNTLTQELNVVDRTMKKPTRYNFEMKTIDQYNQWLEYEESLLKQKISVLNRYKMRLSEFEYNFHMTSLIKNCEFAKIQHFIFFKANALKDKTAGLTLKDMCALWDSTQYNQKRDWLTSLTDYYDSPHIMYYISMMEVRRKFGFDTESDTLRSKEKRTYLYFEDSKKRFKGLTRERALAYMLDEPVMMEIGLQNDMTQYLLGDYYSQPGFKEYKDWVRKKEQEYKIGASRQGAVNFSLTDMQGRAFTKDHLKGKIALMGFWSTGCKPCLETTPNLQKIEDTFRGDSNVILVNISTDTEKNTWLQSITEGKYTTANALNLYTGGEGTLHPMLTFYPVANYPEFYLLDHQGKIVQFPLPDPRNEEGLKAVIHLIQKEIAKKVRDDIANTNDGPYIIHDTGSSRNFQIINNHLVSNQFSNQGLSELKCATDRKDDYVTINLKNKLRFEPSEYSQPDHLLAFSDIEGNFDALRNLLQNNGVVDSAYNWTFGDGHLVFAGDMFDRGNQVTECLWLLYSLEEKAQVAGGYVHFVLGNHELMNLYGKHKYSREKYIANAKRLGKSLAELYNENSELGRWLRTKNIVEKIGDMLFAHGGISEEINNLKLPINVINELARPHYADSSKTYNDAKLNLIMSRSHGPFWYRGYYRGRIKNLEAIVDSTLSLYQVNHIVTGHTLVGDTIGVYFNGKIFNTDTRHALEKSEALLLENNCFYRVNAIGNKVLLFCRKRQP